MPRSDDPLVAADRVRVDQVLDAARCACGPAAAAVQSRRSSTMHSPVAPGRRFAGYRRWSRRYCCTCWRPRPRARSALMSHESTGRRRVAARRAFRKHAPHLPIARCASGDMYRLEFERRVSSTRSCSTRRARGVEDQPRSTLREARACCGPGGRLLLVEHFDVSIPRARLQAALLLPAGSRRRLELRADRQAADGRGKFLVAMASERRSPRPEDNNKEICVNPAQTAAKTWSRG